MKFEEKFYPTLYIRRWYINRLNNCIQLKLDESQHREISRKRNRDDKRDDGFSVSIPFSAILLKLSSTSMSMVKRLWSFRKWITENNSEHRECCFVLFLFVSARYSLCKILIKRPYFFVTFNVQEYVAFLILLNILK